MCIYGVFYLKIGEKLAELFILWGTFGVGVCMKVVNSVFNNLAIDDYKLFGEKVDVISDRIQNLKLPVQSRIGVLAKRNIDTVATICAILKNDFVFVPIEETYSHSIAVCMLLSCYAACYI